MTSFSFLPYTKAFARVVGHVEKNIGKTAFFGSKLFH
jgi:hypothetical protein